MGKRKERRLAALGATGRRVKLDLFAEPSDLGGSPINDEVEGPDQNNRAGVPNSSSSSDNPLLLLGQYTDDELNEEEHKRPKHDTSEISSTEQSGQVEELVGIEGGDEENNAEDLADQQDKEDRGKEGSPSDVAMDMEDQEVRESVVTATGDVSTETDNTIQISDPGSSGMQTTGDVPSMWKVVMHEESNRYYYWNTETGETSWEIPEILSQRAEADNQRKGSPVMEERSISVTTASSNLDVVLNVDSSIPAIDESNGANLIPNVEEKSDYKLQIDNWNEKQKEGSQKVLDLDPAVNSTEPNGIDNKDEIKSMTTEHHEASLSTRLLAYGETLLRRLKALEGCTHHSEGLDWISKYTLEIEIRLSDFKSLFAYGSTLLPFWLHSENKLQGLERAIDDEVCQLSKSGRMNEAEIRNISISEDDKILLQSFAAEESEVNGVFSTLEQPCTSSALVNTSQGIQEEVHEKSIIDDASVEHMLLSGSPIRHLGIDAERNMAEIKETAPSPELVLKPEPCTSEDMDMDVDMEVDDETTASHRTYTDVSTAEHFTPVEHMVQPRPPVDFPSFAVQEDYNVPPPPDEEWIPPPPPDNEPIPPPPPDNEPIPPPPPDEPLLPAYPPDAPYPESLQVLPYTEQYSYAYPVSGFQYYGPPVSQVSSTTYYANTEGCQINDPQPIQYYETTPNSYSDVTPVVVNPVQPFVYYDLPSGTEPVVDSVESSGLYAESNPVNYPDTVAPDRKETLAESECSSVRNVTVGADGGSISSKMTSVQVPPLSATIQATATVTVNNEAPALSTTVVSASVSTIAPSTSVPKGQSKVIRKKKTVAVAPTLRSNKKVSSLVDKWKAAKEELHEDDEDEPENAYEMLEKKKQREIEEWRARQIASGEAKDNANFQPLGGDWRERVKRKRAQSKKTSQAVPVPIKEPVNGKQKPDLLELAKDLPSGWQAYWDESSKEVYYGNLVSSETTWTRPAR